MEWDPICRQNHFWFLKRFTSRSIPLFQRCCKKEAGVREFSERLVCQALVWEGTASGEHGIGLVKRGFTLEEHRAGVAWMHRLKALFELDGLLNPDKLI